MYPAPEDLRKDMIELRLQQSDKTPPSPLHAFSRGGQPVDAGLQKQLVVLGVVVFLACLGLVALNAYARDVSHRMENPGSVADNVGAGASIAMESSFPARAPVSSYSAGAGQFSPHMQSAASQYGWYQGNQLSVPTHIQPQENYMPSAAVMPTYSDSLNQPVGIRPHCMMVPVEDSGSVRVRRIVNR